MTRERSSGLNQRIPCKPFAEIAQQDPCDARGTTAADNGNLARHGDRGHPAR